MQALEIEFSLVIHLLVDSREHCDQVVAEDYIEEEGVEGEEQGEGNALLLSGLVGVYSHQLVEDEPERVDKVRMSWSELVIEKCKYFHLNQQVN